MAYSSVVRFTGAALLCIGGACAHAGTEQAPVAVYPDSGDSGYLQSITRLAERYEHGEGVAKDFARANDLYCEAAKQGYAQAQFRLGWVYANGRGVPRDDGVAAALFAMAADQGHEHAARLLAYVIKRPETKMPACLRPDPPVAAAAPEAAVQVRGVPDEIEKLVQRLASRYSVDYRLALAVISVESGFDRLAVSPKKAQGLMQLIPETAKRFGVTRVFDAAENLKGGLAYLRWLLAYFQGDVRLVLAAYNAGEGAVEKYQGVPPYPETRRYVDKVTSVYTESRHPYEAGVVEPSAIVTKRNNR